MVSINDIQDKIKDIEQKVLVEPESLKEKTVYAYCKKSLHDIKHLLDKNLAPPELVESLKTLLRSNWELINGTLLSYTALPYNDITELFCDIALFVAQYKNQSLGSEDTPVEVVELLMPTVAVDSTLPHKHPNLSSFWDEQSQRWQCVDIMQILKTHLLGRQGLYLIPIKLVTELDPQTPQKLMNYYYDMDVHSPKMTVLNEEEFQRLKEHSTLTLDVFANLEAYNNYANGEHHLLGQLNLLLRHLRLNSVQGIGTEKIAGEGTYAAIYNFMETYERLSPEKIETVPPKVREAIRLIKAHAARDTDTLKEMGSSNSCISILRNRLQSGMEGHEAVLSGITLDKNDQDSLLADKKENLNHSIQYAAHFIDSRQELECSDRLGISSTLLTALGVDFKIETLDDFSLVSADEMIELFRNKSEAEILAVVNLFSHSDDFAFFLINNTDNKASAFLTLFGVSIWKKIFYVDMVSIHSLSVFVSTLEALEDDKKRTLFIQHLLESHIEISIARDGLRHFIKSLVQSEIAQKMQLLMLVWVSLAARIYANFNSIYILNSLDYPQKKEVLMLLIDALPEIVTTTKQFIHLLSFYESADYEIVLNAFKDKLPHFIETPQDVLVLELLIAKLSTPNQAYLVHHPHLRGPCIAALMKNPEKTALILGEDIHKRFHILKWLDPEQQLQIITLLTDKLPTITTTNEQLAVLLSGLDIPCGAIVLTALKDKLPELLGVCCADKLNSNRKDRSFSDPSYVL
jgi:hypothetical protein